MKRFLGNRSITDLAGANTEQAWRVFKAEHLGIGHPFTILAVRAELREAKGWRDEGPMAAVTPMELLRLYARIEEAETSSERYAILAEPIPEAAQRLADRPSFWFDIIHGLTAPHILQSIGRAAFELADNGNKPWRRALDLGSGTGNLSAVLLGRHDPPRSVESLTAVDRESPLLAIANTRYPEVGHVRGDVTGLPFPDESFDLITSGGLAYALDPEDQIKFFKGVGRLLRPGGAYLDGNYRNGFLHPDTAPAGPKHDLEDFIVSHVAPTEIAPLYEPEDFARFGLTRTSREYRGTRPDEIVDIRVLQKAD